MLSGGVKGFLEYKSSTSPTMSFDLAYLRFFTKDYLQRRYAGLTAKKLPATSTLPSFRLYADEKDLDSLSLNLPSSGKIRYIQGNMKVDPPTLPGEVLSGEMLSSEIQLRYRGGLPLHWLYDKKSFRVKLPPYTTYLGLRKFNLVNPSSITTVTDMVSYDLSRAIGLLTPEYVPARVYINNNYNGLHFFLGQVGESFLRKNKRMPGSIYSGDTNYVPNPFGKNKGIGEIVFKDDDVPLMWGDERLWQKDASRNAESEKDRRDIKMYIEITNMSDSISFFKNFESYFDKDKYYSFWGLDTLLGCYHHDNFHNHKIYFDPYKGKFEPIEWDIRYWSSYYNYKDLIMVPLLKKVKLNPVLEYERDLVAYKLLKRFTVEDVIARIDDTKAKIGDELAADPYRQSPSEHIVGFPFNKEVPFSMKEFQSSVEKLKKMYQQRYKFLNRVYEHSRAEYTLVQYGKEDVLLSIAVFGNGPINFGPWELIPESLSSQVKIVRAYQQKSFFVPKGAELRLYPGRRMLKGNIVGRADNRTNVAFGKERAVVSPIHYQFVIKNINLSDLDGVEKIIAANSITGKEMTIKPVEKLPGDEKTESIHPWSLFSYKQDVTEEIILSGEIDIMEDRVYSKNQQVKILPGTIIRLAKDRSLIFYGKVSAAGTITNPIKFKQRVKGKPWGSIVIQGKEASGSFLSHIQVSGGSVSTQRLINYPGQLNIHDVDSFLLEHCIIRDNQIGDDALHVAYSKGSINNCRFENTAFDALDMDISEVTVTNSKFYNIGNDALDVMTSNIKIHDVEIDGAGDKCISIGEESDVLVKKGKLYNCHAGIAVKDQSKAYVEDLEFRGYKEKAISLYRKNARYGYGGEIDGVRLYGITENDISLDSGSVNRISAGNYLPAVRKAQ
jgi:hypothetical protein